MKKCLLVILVIISIGFPFAEGHPFLIDSDPALSSNVLPGTTKIITYYSEAVEIDFSVVKVFDSNGEQIDNRDTSYFQEETSLQVTTPPLEDGVYTVTSKVLSKVDGHLVDYAFVFAVGDVAIDPSLLEGQTVSESVFIPEGVARFPGLVGQTIVLGTLISSLLIWSTQRKDFIKDEITKLQQTFNGKFFSVTGLGIILVFVSNILMLVVQTIRLETSALDVIQTSFGTTWIIRMGITFALIVAWFVIDRRPNLTIKNQFPLLIISLALISTTTMMGHGMASEQGPAIVLDYIHNLIAAIWIGGIIFFGFILLPSISRLESKSKEQLSLLMIPRFSIMFVIALGILIISGPTLLWFLESNVGSLLESTYGQLIIAKIGIAIGMIAIGGYNQFKIQKTAEKKLESITVHKKLRKSLRIESILGIILLGVVALLTNSSLPAGEIQQVQAQETILGFYVEEFSEQAKFDVSIFPFGSGTNSISVVVTDLNGNPLGDMNDLKVKISNPQRSISPILVTMNEIKPAKDDQNSITHYEGEITFGFSGRWQVEIEAHRTENVNENISLDLIVKPRLSQLKFDIVEFELPEEAAPLYPLYDGNGNIWISDPSKPRLWKFSIDDQTFQSFEFEGQTTVFLTIDNDGKIWFVDTPGEQLGFLDPTTEEIELFSLPNKGIAIALEVDFDNNIWIAVVDRHALLKYDQITGQFQEYLLPTIPAGPSALLLDSSGNIWFTESQSGKIGFIEPDTGKIKEFVPEVPIEEPFALFFDSDEKLWIAEHVGLGIVKFDPILETFEKISVPDPESLPFGITSGKYLNIWFAQHTVDKIGVYNPHTGKLIEVNIPTSQSFTQFLTTDKDGNIWFVEQRGGKIGMIKISEILNSSVTQAQTEKINLKYSELVSPLISLGIIATSLFFVKSIHDKRRINSMIK